MPTIPLNERQQRIDTFSARTSNKAPVAGAGSVEAIGTLAQTATTIGDFHQKRMDARAKEVLKARQKLQQKAKNLKDGIDIAQGKAAMTVEKDRLAREAKERGQTLQPSFIKEAINQYDENSSNAILDTYSPEAKAKLTENQIADRASLFTTLSGTLVDSKNKALDTNYAAAKKRSTDYLQTAGAAPLSRSHPYYGEILSTASLTENYAEGKGGMTDEEKTVLVRDYNTDAAVATANSYIDANKPSQGVAFLDFIKQDNILLDPDRFKTTRERLVKLADAKRVDVMGEALGREAFDTTKRKKSKSAGLKQIDSSKEDHEVKQRAKQQFQALFKIDELETKEAQTGQFNDVRQIIDTANGLANIEQRIAFLTPQRQRIIKAYNAKIADRKPPLTNALAVARIDEVFYGDDPQAILDYDLTLELLNLSPAMYTKYLDLQRKAKENPNELPEFSKVGRDYKGYFTTKLMSLGIAGGPELKVLTSRLVEEAQRRTIREKKVLGVDGLDAVYNEMMKPVNVPQERGFWSRLIGPSYPFAFTIPTEERPSLHVTVPLEFQQIYRERLRADKKIYNRQEEVDAYLIYKRKKIQESEK